MPDEAIFVANIGAKDLWLNVGSSEAPQWVSFDNYGAREAAEFTRTSQGARYISARLAELLCLPGRHR